MKDGIWLCEWGSQGEGIQTKPGIQSVIQHLINFGMCLTRTCHCPHVCYGCILIPYFVCVKLNLIIIWYQWPLQWCVKDNSFLLIEGTSFASWVYILMIFYIYLQKQFETEVYHFLPNLFNTQSSHYILWGSWATKVCYHMWFVDT